MTDTITFYHNPMSRGRIVRWMLEETGAPYELKVLRFERNEQKSPEFLAINPMGKVPAIVHRGVVVTECAAICAYLADAFPAAQLAPDLADAARGPYLRWLFFGAGCVEPALMDRVLSRPPAEKRVAIGYGSYEDVVGALERAITPGPYILGARFSAADLYIAAEMGFGIMVGSLESRPLFDEYVARCRSRDAYRRATELDERLAAEQKERA